MNRISCHSRAQRMNNVDSQNIKAGILSPASQVAVGTCFAYSLVWLMGQRGRCVMTGFIYVQNRPNWHVTLIYECTQTTNTQYQRRK